MTPDEALRLCRLAKAASPAQAVDEYTPDLWALVLKPWRLVDAEQALAELASEQEWIHVSHVVARVKRMRSERVKRYFANVSPPSGLSPGEYAEWQRKTITDIADGNFAPEPPRQVEGHRDVIRELGQAKSVDDALASRPAREAVAAALRAKQEAEAEKKRAEDERRADREAAMAAARAALRGAASEEGA